MYTSVSRVRYQDQLVRVLPPGDAQDPVVPTDVQANPNRALIEARLKRYVVEDRQKKRPKYTGAHHKLTVDHVLGMIDAANKKCTAMSTSYSRATLNATGRPSASIDWMTVKATITGTFGSHVYHVIADISAWMTTPNRWTSRTMGVSSGETWVSTASG